MDQQYQEKQRQRYASSTGAAALDPLWRAASDAGYLQRHETSQDAFTPVRIAELTLELGWD
jgi:hypothetical protein